MSCVINHTGSLRTGIQEKTTMQPLLVGLTAVVGFLFIVFAILIMKRIFFKKDRNEEMADTNGYDNKALEVEAAEEQK
ncbi:hypothetical protein P4O66_022641, partial [Electrophorus voltai]